jgi:DNA-binding NarL/FixJ family response regulator
MSPSEQLNRTEVRVATRVWQGDTNPEIPVAFGTSEQVIKNHLRSIFDKLGFGAVWNSPSMWRRMGEPTGTGLRGSRMRRQQLLVRLAHCGGEAGQ